MTYKDPQKAKEYQKKWYQERKAEKADYYSLHRDEILAKRREQWATSSPEDKERHKASSKKYYESHKKQAYKANQKSRLPRMFGISVEELDAMYEKQKGKCAICGKPENGRKLAIDHNHKTGKVRALLCGKCNKAIGLLDDDTNILKKAIKYLMTHVG